MEVHCTRPGCSRPQNYFSDLENHSILRTVQQKYCTACGMPLILAGRYLPKKLLGQGGFGTAFLAIDRYTPGIMRQCVVKQFQPVGNLSPTQMQLAQDLFEREAVVLEEIGNQHNQIPALFAYFPLLVENFNCEQEQFFYLVQEYIDGRTLEEELVEKGRFSQVEVVEILREVLSILEFVHNKNIIHRDIKPSNIMRHRNGKLFLLDFGAVKQVKQSFGSNRSSTGIYSLGFSPPEQVSGGEIFPCTDLYALGFTAVTLLTGEQEVNKLFDAHTNQIKWRSHVQINPKLADILDKMLIAAANQRFGTATEVLKVLNTQVGFLPQKKSETVGQIQRHIQPPIKINSKSKAIPPTQLNRSFSTIEILVGAAFTGFEGGLVAIALLSLLPSTAMSLICAFAIFVTLIFSQINRWIEKIDLLIIPIVTLLIIFFVPLLRGNLGIGEVIIVSFGISLAAVALTSLFRLIYKLLSLLI